jgi:hypothetical protein
VSKPSAEHSLVLLHWRDVYDDTTGWSSVADWAPTRPPVHVVSAGYLLFDLVDGYYTLASTFYEEDGERQYSGFSHYPKGMVEGWEVLE